MLLLLCTLPLFRRYHYEPFLISHLLCAIVLVYSTWRHVRKTDGLPKNCLLATVSLSAATLTFRAARVLARNITNGQFPSKLTLTSNSNPDSDDAFHVTIVLPRPWKIQAGEWIRLSVPRVGFWSLFQSHPFMVVWSESNSSSLSLLIKPRSGFT